MTQTAAEHDLRFLYGNVKKMLQSDNTQPLYNGLIEDLVDFIGFERIMVLSRNSATESLESQAAYGFQDSPNNTYSLPLAKVNGLFQQVLTNREALAVYDFPEALSTTDVHSRRDDIISNISRDDHQPNRREKINLYLTRCPSVNDTLNSDEQSTSYSIKSIDAQDTLISSLLGDTPSFLILPMCNGKAFYGYVLLDNGQSGTDISFDRIRHASTIVNHAALSLKGIVNQQGILDTVGEQKDKANRKKRFYRNIFQNLRSGLVTIDEEMKITEANKAVETILGYDCEQLPGQPVNIFFADQQIINQYSYVDLIQAIQADMGVLPEVSLQRKDGTTFPAEVCFSIITDRDNTVFGLSCAFRDLTNRKTLEQGLARMDKLASLGEMAAGVAHEIKNPLAGIAGALQIISQNYQEESQHQYIFNEVLGQVKRIDSFVNDLLHFARPGKTKFMRINLKEVLDKTVLLFSTQAPDQHIAITVDLCCDTVHLVMGDEGQLQQVFFNIIHNAIDAMDEGGELKITSSCENYSSQTHPQAKCTTPCCSPHGRIKICFKDTGKGMDSRMLESIFNPFHTTKSNGKGLGLPIASRIVEQHKGTITVDSEPGAGSTFTVLLPLYITGKSLDA
ncbi:MAG: PAS domain S-box protein [Desulfocapsa sp.]|nr:PAS domain S-box protein [Desulfocapsa sp.]